MGIVCNMADVYGETYAALASAVQSQRQLTDEQVDDLHDLLSDMIADLLHFGLAVKGDSPAHPEGIAPDGVLCKAIVNLNGEMADHRAGVPAFNVGEPIPGMLENHYTVIGFYHSEQQRTADIVEADCAADAERQVYERRELDGQDEGFNVVVVADWRGRAVS